MNSVFTDCEPSQLKKTKELIILMETRAPYDNF